MPRVLCNIDIEGCVHFFGLITADVDVWQRESTQRYQRSHTLKFSYDPASSGCIWPFSLLSIATTCVLSPGRKLYLVGTPSSDSIGLPKVGNDWSGILCSEGHSFVVYHVTRVRNRRRCLATKEHRYPWCDDGSWPSPRCGTPGRVTSSRKRHSSSCRLLGSDGHEICVEQLDKLLRCVSARSSIGLHCRTLSYLPAR